MRNEKKNVSGLLFSIINNNKKRHPLSVVLGGTMCLCYRFDVPLVAIGKPNYSMCLCYSLVPL